MKTEHTIIQIDDCLVSSEILTEYFACDYEKCKGCCCIIGDSGAPLKECEAGAIEKNYPVFSPLMRQEGTRWALALGMAQAGAGCFLCLDMWTTSQAYRWMLRD